MNNLYSQSDVDLNLTIINSGKYSLSSFIDPNINLWQVDIINNYGGDDVKDLRLEVEMLKDGVKVIWGVSESLELSKDTFIEPRTNMNFTGTNLSFYEEDESFRNQVES